MPTTLALLAVVIRLAKGIVFVLFSVLSLCAIVPAAESLRSIPRLPHQSQFLSCHNIQSAVPPVFINSMYLLALTLSAFPPFLSDTDRGRRKRTDGKRCGGNKYNITVGINGKKGVWRITISGKRARVRVTYQPC